MTLGQATWKQQYYSALAGFVEPGEVFEDAVKRELWEEAGVRVWDIKYHSSQPWVSNQISSMGHGAHFVTVAPPYAAFPS